MPRMNAYSGLERTDETTKRRRPIGADGINGGTDPELPPQWVRVPVCGGIGDASSVMGRVR